MQTEIKRWGNSAALRLPSKLLAQAHLEIATPVDINVEAGKIIIQARPKKQKKVRFPFTEKQLLKGLNAKTAHADELASLTANEIGER